MPEASLAFMNAVSPAAYKHYDLAYRHCYEDPENSLVKLRACALILVDMVYAHFEIKSPSGATLYDKINAPHVHKWMPYYICEKFNYLRVQGNRGAHPGTSFRSLKAARDTAIVGLKTAYKIAAWIYETAQLGHANDVPPFIEPTEATSDKLYGDAVIRNDAEAQYSVGMIFKQRAETAKNLQADSKQQDTALEDARYWLQKATDQGHAAAMFQLGSLYLHGKGAMHQVLRAEQLIRHAARLGNPDALHRLGVFLLQGRIDAETRCERLPEEAFQCFTQAAEHDHLGALNRLVEMYYEGIAVERDPDQAFQYAEKAALAGYPSAQFKLAHLYQMGMGVAQDEQKAFEWYQEAAQGGDADAQVVMFKYYSNGFVVQKNLLQALEWLQLAEVQGHPGAAYYLGLAYQRGIGGVKTDLVRALNLFKRCIDLDPEGQYQAARIEFTEGVQLLRQQAKQAAQARTHPPFAHKHQAVEAKVKRNDPCPCGSGKKYKRCCMPQ